MNIWDKPLTKWSTLWLAVSAIVSFHLTYLVQGITPFPVIFLGCLFLLANLPTSRRAFYVGMGIGLAIYAPHLRFFWEIFQGGAIALWIILSFWLGLFVVLGRACLLRFGLKAWACAAPFFWIGLEYFRSELYFFKFSWLNVGYALSNSGSLPYFSCYGVYGVGFVLMTIAVFFSGFRRLTGIWVLVLGIAVALELSYPSVAPYPQLSTQPSFRITGVQLEFPSLGEALAGLDNAVRKFPNTDLLVLSEYSFMGPVPSPVKKWCRNHQKYLVVGAEQPVSTSQFYNTAFVVSPAGEIIFQQAKCVPVQLMKDGLAATNQDVWNSPWGKIGFGICYDASYTRVTDKLIREGAQALIFPTMDTMEWGEYQHRLHARIAPMRAAEYAVSVFRLCSSGISQFIDPRGRMIASAPFPGQGAIMSGKIVLTNGGRMPPDRWLGPFSVGVIAVFIVVTAIKQLRQRLILSASETT